MPDAAAGVYYYTGEAAKGTPISVLADDQVTVNNSVTKENMDALEASGATLPTLTFKAYAIQKLSLIHIFYTHPLLPFPGALRDYIHLFPQGAALLR